MTESGNCRIAAALKQLVEPGNPKRGTASHPVFFSVFFVSSLLLKIAGLW